MSLRFRSNFLMLLGFIPTLLCVGLLQFAKLSSTEHVIVMSIQYLGTGIGSIGLGLWIALRKSK